MHFRNFASVVFAAAVAAFLQTDPASSQTPGPVPTAKKPLYRKFDAGSAIYYVDVDHIRRYFDVRGHPDVDPATAPPNRAEVIVYTDTGGGPYQLMSGVQQWQFTCGEARQRMTVLGSGGFTTYVPPGSIMAEIGVLACIGP